MTGSTWVDTVFDSRFWLVGLISAIFFLGLRIRLFRLLQPYVFLTTAIIPLTQLPESVYGFGLFTVGSLMLLVDGQLDRNRIVKVTLLGAYFLTIVIVATIVSQSPLEGALGFFLFITAFFLYLFFTFHDRIIVFVRTDKPLVHLSDKNLTPKETTYLLTLLDGKSMKEVAWIHGVNESTVRNSLSRCYAKLGVKDLSGLVRWAEGHTIKP